jgi:transmembrane sensor
MIASQQKELTAIREAAAEWVMRLGGAQPLAHADKVAFCEWLRASPIHVREYLNAEATRHLLGQAVSEDSTDVQELLAQARSNVIALSVDTPPGADVEPAPEVGRKNLRHLLRKTVAAAVVVSIAVAAAVWSGMFVSYSTDVGEMRTVMLRDGSIVELNTNSKIRVHFTKRSRDVYLSRGEAFFAVAKDPERPFEVMSDTALIRAVGTDFNVYRKHDQTIVTVVHGKVVVSADSPASSPAIFHQGDIHSGGPPLGVDEGHRAVIDTNPGTRSQVSQSATADTDSDISWRQSRLIFHNEPLTKVITEFNRYNRKQIVIANPELARRGISGVFDPRKPQGLLLFLQRTSDVETVEPSEDQITLR